MRVVTRRRSRNARERNTVRISEPLKREMLSARRNRNSTIQGQHHGRSARTKRGTAAFTTQNHPTMKWCSKLEKNFGYYLRQQTVHGNPRQSARAPIAPTRPGFEIRSALVAEQPPRSLQGRAPALKLVAKSGRLCPVVTLRRPTAFAVTGSSRKFLGTFPVASRLSSTTRQAVSLLMVLGIPVPSTRWLAAGRSSGGAARVWLGGQMDGGGGARRGRR